MIDETKKIKIIQTLVVGKKHEQKTIEVEAKKYEPEV
jgi:hypothetical protein